MSDSVRGLVLLCSVLLWLPFLRPLLDGDLTVDQGLVRYAGALLLAWVGGAGLTALVRGYAAQSEQSGSEQSEHGRSEHGRSESAGDQPRRRAQDRAS